MKSLGPRFGPRVMPIFWHPPIGPCLWGAVRQTGGTRLHLFWHKVVISFVVLGILTKCRILKLRMWCDWCFVPRFGALLCILTQHDFFQIDGPFQGLQSGPQVAWFGGAFAVVRPTKRLLTNILSSYDEVQYCWVTSILAMGYYSYLSIFPS